MTEHLLIIGNGYQILERVRAVRPDVRTTVLLRLALLDRVRRPVDHRRVIGLPHDQGVNEWIAAARSVHERDPFDHLGTYSERDQDKAAAVGAALNLRTHGMETVRLVHDKIAMRERLRSSGVDPTPAARAYDLDGVQDFAARHGYPVVLKPIAGASSAGVSVIRGDYDLKAAWSWAKAATGLDANDLLVEPYIAGPELSVEAFSENREHRIVCLTGKAKESRHCVEFGHVVPGPFDVATTEMVGRFTISVLDALGVRDGVTHTEIILGQEGLRVVETHLRPAGDRIPEMIIGRLGIDLADLMIRRSLGESMLGRLDQQLASAPDTPQHEAVWFATPPAAGEVLSVHGLEAARSMTGVISVEPLKQAGDQMSGRLVDSFARTVAARAVAREPAEAICRARAAAETVQFTVRTDATSGLGEGELLSTTAGIRTHEPSRT